MTEKQWLRSANAEAMNEFYGQRHTERKARLLMLATCQRHPAELQHEPIRAMLELLVAHYADPRELHKPFAGADLLVPYRKLERFASKTESGPTRGLAFGLVAAAEPAAIMKKLQEDFSYLVYSCIHDVAVGVSAGTSTKKESKYQAALFREILGDPFKPITLDPAWLTDTVISLARQVHETEEFSMMPVLADALQEAGCENDAILNHCRDEKQAHVRGCWLLDLILEGATAQESKTAPKRKPRAKKAKP